MRILYPSDPSNAKAPDDLFAAEYDAASSLGLPLSLFSFEDLAAGVFRARPSLAAQEQVLYRGWMLAAERYPTLANAIRSQGACPFTEPEQYTLCHHLPQWYPLLAELTPPTQVFAQGDDYITALHGCARGRAVAAESVEARSRCTGSVCVRRRRPTAGNSECQRLEKY